MRRVDCASRAHLKCFTAFVTYTSSRSIPAASNARSRSVPDGPTNGRPALSSASPGCSPTTITRERDGPSPNTVCVPSLNRPQPRQPFDAARSAESDACGGMKSAAEPVGFAILFGFVVLLTVFLQAVTSGNRAAVRVDAVAALGRAFGFFAAAMLAMQPFDERGVRLVAVSRFVVRLSALLLTVALSHVALARAEERSMEPTGTAARRSG